MLPLLDVQFEWYFADAKLSLLKYGSFVSVAVHIFAWHNLFVSTDLIFYMKSVVYYGYHFEDVEYSFY